MRKAAVAVPATAASLKILLTSLRFSLDLGFWTFLGHIEGNLFKDGLHGLQSGLAKSAGAQLDLNSTLIGVFGVRGFFASLKA